MFNYLQKHFLVFLLLDILSLDAMKRTKTNILENVITQKDQTLPTHALLYTLDKIPYITGEDWEIIKKCLQQGADPNLKFGPYKTPLILFLVEKQKKDLFDLALKKGAYINACNVYGWTPLHLAAAYSRNNDKTNLTVEYLLIHGANVDAITENRENPLSWALRNENNNAANVLIKYGSDSNVNHMSNEYTSVGLAISNINYQSIIQLFYKKASINIHYHGSTVFHLMANLITKRYKVPEPEQLITTVMTHPRFDINEQIKTEAILLALYGIKKADIILYNNLDLRYLILSKILSAEYLPRKLYNSLLKRKAYDYLPLELVSAHIEKLKQALQIQNSKNKTALELLNDQKNAQYTAIMQPYLDGSKVENDFNEFKSVFTQILKDPKSNIQLNEKVDPNNLALQIYNIHYAPPIK